MLGTELADTNGGASNVRPAGAEAHRPERRCLTLPQVRTLWLMLGVFGLVFTGGVIATSTLADDYRTSGSLVLVPRGATDTEDVQQTVNYTETTALGTWVEQVDSAATGARPGPPGVAITVRAVPDTRVIKVRATGARDAVQPAVAGVMDKAVASGDALDDRWTLRTIERAGAAEPAGPTLAKRLGASVALALLGALAVIAFLGWPTGASATPYRPRTLAPAHGSLDT